ncbi:zig-4 [Pristionchus pacificus]|nr:zig-4 [Pristionchus pacificus]
MNTCLLLLLSTLALAQSRFLLAPSVHKHVDPEVSVADTSLLVDPPSVSFTAHSNLTSTRFTSGDELSFYCEAVGTPMINVYWTLNGKIVQGHRRRSNLERLRNEGKVMIGQNVVGSKLELECVDERMTGTLSCVADNGVEIVKSSVQISTTGAHECARMRPARPQIGTWTKSRIEEIGNSAIFQCRKASAGVSIRWENDEGKELKKEDGFVVLPNGDLLIPSLQWEMMGSYLCVATSEEGEERQETFVFPTDENAPEPSGDGGQDYEEY